MKSARVMRVVTTLTTGAILMQVGGCSLGSLTEMLQTVFLGISAAGGLAILQNI